MTGVVALFLGWLFFWPQGGTVRPEETVEAASGSTAPAPQSSVPDLSGGAVHEPVPPETTAVPAPALEPRMTEPPRQAPSAGIPPAAARRGSTPSNDAFPVEPEPAPQSGSPSLAPWSPPRVIPPAPIPKAAPVGSGLVDGQAFGRTVKGVLPELLDRLQDAEHRAAKRLRPSAAPPPEEEYGIYSLVGYRAGSKAHSSGRAVDVNYYANPYIMHEQGEAALDHQLGPVYQRIARLMLGRDSVIPEGITEGSPDETRALTLFHRLREESDAMVGYFALMQDRKKLAAYLSEPKRRAELRTLLPEEDRLTPEAVQRRMLADYVILAGRPGPAVAGLEYPAVPPITDTAAVRSAEPHPGDRPFEGDPRYRAPETGFLLLREEVFRALLEAGLRWGGTDMGNQSGDLMHFYIPASGKEQKR